MLYLTGARMNKFGRGQSTGISPAVHAVSSVANAYDNDPSTPVIFGSVAANSYLSTNVNALANPGFESTFPGGWTDGSSGGGTVTRTTTAGQFVTGVAGADFTASAGVAYYYQDITVSAGEWRRNSITTKNNAGGFSPFHIIGNLKTGNYWNGSAWASGFQGVAITDTGSFVEYTQTYQVESAEVCMADTVTLRVGVYATGNTGFVDNVFDVPGISFAGVFGHNLGPVITGGVTTLYKSTDFGATYGTLVSSMTIRRPSYFSTFTMDYSPDWKLLLPGTPHEAPWFGEIVLGQYQTSATSPKWGIAKTRSFPASRQRGPSGRPHVYNYATDPPQDIEMAFSARTAADSRELAESIWLRSGQGLHPVIVVPIDTETDVFYGRLMDGVGVTRPFHGVFETTLMLTGDPTPTVGL